MSEVVDFKEAEGKLFKERMNKENPNHAKHYCPHGRYIGSTMKVWNCESCCMNIINFWRL